ncbi:hypothetical protein ACQW07_17465 [Paenarthrobacter nitroguajacolicus]|uniref:hypothetical protein n=1 Tax=Paenarthrobacter nitroguajacolicus TaxID=211146 RepID=UPI003D1ACA32
MSTLIGDANRNGYQQRKAGWLGGPGSDGGHAAPSALGFIGERGGTFPQHEWQNRKAGTPNEIDEANNFHDTEMEVIKKAKTLLQSGAPLDLRWEMKLEPGSNPGMPLILKLLYSFDDEISVTKEFNNLRSKQIG